MSTHLGALWSFIRARKRIICIMAPVILGLLYMVLCMAQLRQSIWFDESYSAYLTRFEYPKVWDLTSQDVHPPLYYFALKTWAHFFGHTDFAMRMLSVICGAVAILFAYLWLKYKYGATAAITASALLAISPVFVRYGQEMRMYTLVLAIVFAATYVLQLAIDNGKKRWWAMYAILLALGMWTHYFCAFAWIAHLVYLFLVYRKKIFQKKIILSYIGAVALFAPWVPSLIRQTASVESGFWIGDVSFHTLANYVTESLVFQKSGDLKGWLLILVLLAIVTIIALAIASRKKLRMLLSMMLVPLLALILLSMPPLSPMFVTRYILFSIVSISLVAGVGLVLYVRSLPKPKARSKRKTTIFRALSVSAAVLVLVGTSAAGISSVYTTGNYNFNSNTKSASKELYDTIVTLDNNKHLAIICASPWVYFDMSFYSTKENSVYFMNETTKYDMGSLYPLRDSYTNRIDDLDAFIAKRDSFWYITSIDEDGELEKTFPRDDWRIEEYTTSKFNDFSDTYAIVKMVKE